MKRIFTFLTLIGMSLSVMGQTGGKYPDADVNGAFAQNNARPGRNAHARQQQTNTTKTLQIDNYIEQKWDATTSSMVNYWKEEFGYDAIGNDSLYHVSIWHNNTQTWVDTLKYVEFRDSNNKDTVELAYKWDVVNAKWVYNFKQIYTYDVNGNYAVITGYAWNAGSKSWDLSQRYEYIYDADNNNTVYTVYYYSTESGWIPGYKYEYTYDENRNATALIYSIYSSDAGDWGEAEQYARTYVYDSHENITSITYSYLNYGTGHYLNSQQNIYTYDLSVSMDSVLAPTSYVPFYKNKPLTITVYTNPANSSGLTKAYQYTWNYSQVAITGINDEKFDKTSVRVYPNPAKNVITCKFSDEITQQHLIVYDALGNTVINQDVQNNTTVSVTDLAGGLYLYSLSDGKNISKGKLVIE